MKVTKECWVIMDTNKRAIACGSPRDRRMVLIENLNTGRILTYESEKKAISGFTTSGFYDETYYIKPKTRWGNSQTMTYLNETYGKKKKMNASDDSYYWSNPSYAEMCIAVKAKVTVEI